MTPTYAALLTLFTASVTLVALGLLSTALLTAPVASWLAGSLGLDPKAARVIVSASLALAVATYYLLLG